MTRVIGIFLNSTTRQLAYSMRLRRVGLFRFGSAVPLRDTLKLLFKPERM